MNQSNAKLAKLPAYRYRRVVFDNDNNQYSLVDVAKNHQDGVMHIHSIGCGHDRSDCKGCNYLARKYTAIIHGTAKPRGAPPAHKHKASQLPRTCQANEQNVLKLLEEQTAEEARNIEAAKHCKARQLGQAASSKNHHVVIDLTVNSNTNTRPAGKRPRVNRNSRAGAPPLAR